MQGDASDSAPQARLANGGSAAAPAAAPPGAGDLQRLRELSYLDHEAAIALGRKLGEAGGPAAAWGWMHVALGEARLGAADAIEGALRRARTGFEAASDPTGLAWCDEVQAIVRRRDGDFAGSAALQADIDARTDIDREPLYGFVAHNSRAITRKLLGDSDAALRHYYSAHEWACETGLTGPLATALGNLGGYHHDLFNLEDALRLSEQALALAMEAEVRPIVTAAAANLVSIHYARGAARKAREAVAFLLDNPHRLLPDVPGRFPLPLALGHLAVGETDAALRYLERGAVTALGNGDGLCEWAWMKARCQLALGDAKGARETAEQLLHARREGGITDKPYPMMQLLDALADACERLGDHRTALAWQRQAHAHYVQLVGRSARARHIALEVSHQLSTTLRERDRAVARRQAAEIDRRRLADLHAALQAKVAEAEQLQRELQERALRDPLTGLYNRHHLFESGRATLALARRHDEMVCVALLDLDHFKQLNDTCGHAAGDEVLQRFGALLRQHLRRTDIVCRYGGEEFVAVMPGLGSWQAKVALDRLQEDLQRQRLLSRSTHAVPCGFSAGIAQFPQHGHTLEQLLSCADQALYRAKALGRARCEQA